MLTFVDGLIVIVPDSSGFSPFIPVPAPLPVPVPPLLPPVPLPAPVPPLSTPMLLPAPEPLQEASANVRINTVVRMRMYLLKIELGGGGGGVTGDFLFCHFFCPFFCKI
jgi:hypothetical protein